MTKVAPRLALLLMSNLGPGTTGVRGAVIWVAAGEFYAADIQPGPRIKVMPGTTIKRKGLENAASVMIADPPLVVGYLPTNLRQQAIDFVKLNKEVLSRYWHNDVSTRELIEGLVTTQGARASRLTTRSR